MGYVSQIETMGLVDGPGIRTVIFLSGCHLRCLYCHNPEMWHLKQGTPMSPEQIVDLAKRYKNYYGKEGGVTFSGGEPLLQPTFLIQTMQLCHQNGINTCLDTAGVGTKYDEEVLQHTDLVILDIKSSMAGRYQYITSKDIKTFNKFLALCQKLHKPLWLRQVIVPGINDTPEAILALNDFIKTIDNVQKVELIPYHTYGKEKYHKLGLDYPLANTPAMDLDKLQELNKLLNN